MKLSLKIHINYKLKKCDSKDRHISDKPKMMERTTDLPRRSPLFCVHILPYALKFLKILDKICDHQPAVIPV